MVNPVPCLSSFPFPCKSLGNYLGHSKNSELYFSSFSFPWEFLGTCLTWWAQFLVLCIFLAVPWYLVNMVNPAPFFSSLGITGAFLDIMKSLPYFSSFPVSLEFLGTCSTWLTQFLVPVPSQFLGTCSTWQTKFLPSSLALPQHDEPSYLFQFLPSSLGVPRNLFDMANSVPCVSSFPVPWEFLDTCSTRWTQFLV